jgi:hypothetical protein
METPWCREENATKSIKGNVVEGDVEVVVVESINIKSLRAGAQVHINDLRIPRAH